jgi:calcineurin-like phosphoesterase family protein
MPNIFVISDTHFGHANILGFTDNTGKRVRDFSDVTEMNECMIQRWNSVVTPSDKVYHLGDVFFGSEKNAHDVLSVLNGHKRLVVGNHDNLKNKVLHMHFEKISLWRMFPDYGFLLTHVPVHPSTLGESRFTGKQMVNVHGHIHQNKSPEGPYKCVCVEQTNYYPIALEDLKNG